MVGAILMLVLLMSAGVWMTRAETEYFRLVRSRRHPTLVMPHERSELLGAPREAITTIIEFTGSGWRLLLRRQPDPELERARRKVIRRIALVALLLVLFLPVSYTSARLL
jgi:hypothetical protein